MSERPIDVIFGEARGGGKSTMFLKEMAKHYEQPPSGSAIKRAITKYCQGPKKTDRIKFIADTFNIPVYALRRLAE